MVQSCANVQQPAGGPMDKKPPVLKTSYPEQNKINFSGKEIELVFDEEVSTEKVNNTLVITPLKEDDYKIKTKKNTVRLIFQKEFEQNTTYTLNFQNSIQDLTEKNAAQDLTLAFSTGPYMDSISLNGIVTDLHTNAPLENITVGLYKEGDTISLRKGKPIYFIKTDKSGTYKFKNLKNNIYNLYAFHDKNSNLHYEENEKIGTVENLDLNENKKNINITLTTLDTQVPTVSYIIPGHDKTDIKFNEGIIIKKIYLKDSTSKTPYTTTEDGKTITVYNTDKVYDSIPLFASINDSTGNYTDIKQNIIFDEHSTKKDPLTFRTEPLDYKLDPGVINIQLKFNKPITQFTNNIKSKVDSLTIEIPDSSYKWNPTKTILSIKKKIKIKDSLQLETFKNTFISITKDSLEPQKLTFTIKKEEDYGMIRGSIDTKNPDYIIELVDKDYKVIRSAKNVKIFNFQYLLPATYSIRAIIDENKNGKWDNGNIELKKQPEKIIYHKDKIQLRANWEIENITIKF
jgi:uncharacterized protein (DUF2141 family)